ncbi:MAG: transporter substrate-binding protein [Pseudonocardiales bacterium]|nr:transporter substrate-binding protein [Pseudonocardiales bacterium]
MRSRTKRRLLGAVSMLSVATLLAACGSGGDSKDQSNSGKVAYNAGNTSVVNASDKTGGTVTYAVSDAPDSFDPGNTYYAFVWDFSRLYARALTTFKTEPGDAGLEVVPDLAEKLGEPSADGLTWTYTLRKGLKYSDGSPITAKDVKYAIERSNYAPAVLSNGPTYFKDTLKNDTGYKGPYDDPNGDLTSIETPNDTTIVFHLKAPFADFDFLASNPQTAPVPKAKDTGATYVNSIVSSGSYMFTKYEDGKGATLVKNPNWSASSDPLRKQYPETIQVNFGQEQESIDKDLQADTIQVDLSGAGIATSSQSTVFANPDLKKNVDDALSGALAYVAVSTKVAPFDNVHCRIAVQYAIDKAAAQTTYGGEVRGEIASTVLPPNVTGYKDFDTYKTDGNKGDVAKAKDELKQCGQPNGFTTNFAARGDRPAEIALATAIQESLKKVGITANIQQYPSGKYFSSYAGSPQFVHDNNLGLSMSAWAADWPSGYGFLDQVVDGKTIKAAGNTNISELNDPKINSMLQDAITNNDLDARNKLYGEIDKAVMDQAVIVPLLYRKDPLYRPPSATNVFVTAAYGMYDYLNIGRS